MRIKETDRQIEILKSFRNDGTTRKLDDHVPQQEQMYLNQFGFHQSLFVIDGKADWDKFDDLFKKYINALEKDKNLKEYRRRLKLHLRRLKIKWPEYKVFMYVFLKNSMIDILDRYDLENSNRNS